MKVSKFLGLLALTSSFAFVSCSSEEDFSQVKSQEQTTVTFTTSLPAELVSRAATGVDNGSALTNSIYADGLKATTLYYAVYTAESNTLVLTNYGQEGDAAYVNDNVTFSNLVASVKFTLAKNTAYNFVFWAQSPNTELYTFVPATGDLKIDYSKAICNDDNADAFYASVSYTFGNGTTQSVTLTRPFAQLNVGLCDAERARELGLELETSALSIVHVPNQFNLITGEIPVSDGLQSDKHSDALFAFNATPAKQGNAGVFPAKENNEYVDAEYIAMAYVLTTQKAYDMEFNYTTNTGAKKQYGFFSIPLAPNHRTNIYGSGLLLDEENWTIKINNSFIEPDYNESTDDFISW